MLVADSSMALYDQLRILIKNDIINKVYKPGEMMPSETALCEHYGVSRITIRRAVKELEDEGLLTCKQGKGTFVQYPKIHSQILDLGGFTNTSNTEGRKHEAKVLSKIIVEATDEISKYLDLPVGSQVLELHRLMIEDDIPISIDTSYFPLDIFQDIISKIDDNVSTFNIMKEDYGIVMAKAYKEFSVDIAKVEESKLLNCPVGEPLFSINKVIYDLEDRPIHLSKFLVLASQITYVITVKNSLEDMKDK